MQRPLLVLRISRTSECMPYFGSDDCRARQRLPCTVSTRFGTAAASISTASHRCLLLVHGSALSSAEKKQLNFLEKSMPRCVFALAGASLFIFLGIPSRGQTSAGDSSAVVQALDGDDPTAIFEFGAATSWNFKGGAATFAPNLAAEITPVEHWLELEVGVSPFYTHESQEWDIDLLFKKPWNISRKAEFMFGIGPEWVHLRQNGRWRNSIAGEIAADFMFWPTGKHRFGWYLEPAYDYSFASGHEKSIGISGGLLIGVFLK